MKKIIPHQRACRAIALATAGALILSVLTGCAITPHGPVAKHTHITYFPGRTDLRATEDTYYDSAFGISLRCLQDATGSAIEADHTNQTALGGSSHFQAGTLTILVSTNAAPVITAVGTAGGSLVGEGVKTLAK